MMVARCIAVWSVAVLVSPACYMSHAGTADAGPVADEAMDGGWTDAGDDGGGSDGRYPVEDAWDRIVCSDADCPDGMVRIPCGPFVQGSRTGEGRTPAEEPARVAWMSTFCIDRTEVTVAQYFACVVDGGCLGGIDTVCNPDLTADDPVRCVDSGQASGYCGWRHGQPSVPTAAQWEKAARGGCELVPPADCGPEDERRYPWGNDAPSCARANYAGCGGRPLAVGSTTAGASPYGVFDMAGNVAEWVDQDLVNSPPDWTYCHCSLIPETPCISPGCSGVGSVRGGHYDSPPEGITVPDRGPYGPWGSEPHPHLGFRCAFKPW
jgi:formylglycine-generating enzyme required for sulfatase activity